MTGVGLFVIFLGYVILFWAFNSLQGKDQDSFASYLLPSFGK